ncbi:hypothetical protein GIB67_028573 [Kingdonia uniflora]|uniref:Uncharacterized protein n=1 Tax=Kingdonia uniflora TaxID=39325 RepID=A0A7J7NVJ2_9MAGN|nr:hypothetical protein GIB67_028573 [Kingdonia uniflora]
MLWMTALLIDFYINIVAISVWIAYKESSWISAFIWIVLLICFGSITTCIYIVVQLLRLSYQDPIYHVLLDSRSRQGIFYIKNQTDLLNTNGFKLITTTAASS